MLLRILSYPNLYVVQHKGSFSEDTEITVKWVARMEWKHDRDGGDYCDAWGDGWAVITINGKSYGVESKNMDCRGHERGDAECSNSATFTLSQFK